MAGQAASSDEESRVLREMLKKYERIVSKAKVWLQTCTRAVVHAASSWERARPYIGLVKTPNSENQSNLLMNMAFRLKGANNACYKPSLGQFQ